MRLHYIVSHSIMLYYTILYYIIYYIICRLIIYIFLFFQWKQQAVQNLFHLPYMCHVFLAKPSVGKQGRTVFCSFPFGVFHFDFLFTWIIVIITLLFIINIVFVSFSNFWFARISLFCVEKGALPLSRAGDKFKALLKVPFILTLAGETDAVSFFCCCCCCVFVFVVWFSRCFCLLLVFVLLFCLFAFLFFLLFIVFCFVFFCGGGGGVCLFCLFVGFVFFTFCLYFCVLLVFYFFGRVHDGTKHWVQLAAKAAARATSVPVANTAFAPQWQVQDS